MTNQLEEELRAIRNTITEIEKQKQQGTSPEYYRYLSHKLDKLRYEEKRILQQLGLTGDII